MTLLLQCFCANFRRALFPPFLRCYVAHLRQECYKSKFVNFGVIGIERNVRRCTFNRHSVITQFAKLAAGEQLCRRCSHRKL